LEKKQTPRGEVYQYDFERLVHFILKCFGLHDIAQNGSVELCITLDGTELCDGICHLTTGIKITDKRAVNPHDGSPLSSLDDDFGRIFNVQSRNYCFAVKSLLGKDNKDAYKEFSTFFKYFEHVQREGLEASKVGPRILPLIVWCPQDLSSLWKRLNTGSGAQKNGETHFCHVCPCTGNKNVEFTVDENRYVTNGISSLVFFLNLTYFLLFAIDVHVVLGVDGSGAIIGQLVMRKQLKGFSNSCRIYLMYTYNNVVHLIQN
jgi:hypothetical protein